jgi:hypothetical protein
MKVLTFKDAQTGELTYKNWNILPTMVEGIFYHNETCVFKIEEIYFDMGFFNIEGFTKEKQERYYNYLKNFKQNILEKERPNTLDIEVFRLLGLDYQSLAEKRLLFDENRRNQEIEKERQRIEFAEKKRKEREFNTITSLEKLKLGEKIQFSELLDIIELYKIEVHSRTKGLLNTCADNEYSVSKTTATFKKGTAQKTANSVFSLINSICQ